MAKHKTKCCSCEAEMEVETDDVFAQSSPDLTEKLLKAATCEPCRKSPERRMKNFMNRKTQTTLPFNQTTE